MQNRKNRERSPCIRFWHDWSVVIEATNCDFKEKIRILGMMSGLMFKSSGMISGTIWHVLLYTGRIGMPFLIKVPSMYRTIDTGTLPSPTRIWANWKDTEPLACPAKSLFSCGSLYESFYVGPCVCPCMYPHLEKTSWLQCVLLLECVLLLGRSFIATMCSFTRMCSPDG